MCRVTVRLYVQLVFYINYRILPILDIHAVLTVLFCYTSDALYTVQFLSISCGSSIFRGSITATKLWLLINGKESPTSVRSCLLCIPFKSQVLC